MKIYYINGYKGNNSSKPKILSNILNKDINHVVYDYDKNNIEEIYEKVKDADLIIGSSTGAYLIRDFCFDNSVPLISINPVINIKETFNKIGVPVPEIPEHNFRKNIQELVLVTEDDELINYKDTIKKLNNVKSFKDGGHRFKNLERVKNDILEFIKFIY